MPIGAPNFADALQCGAETFHALAKPLKGNGGEGGGKRTRPGGRRLFSPGAPAVGLCIAKQSSRLPALLRFASAAARGGAIPVRLRPVRPEGRDGRGRSA